MDSRLSDDLRGAFAAAAAAPGADTVERTYRVAGRRVHMRVVGAGLAAGFGRSWSHLEAAPGASDEGALRIDISEAAAGARWASDHDAAVTVSPDGRYVSERSSAIEASYDRRRQWITARVRDSHRLPIGTTHKPFQMLVSAWLSDLGVSFVHAGMVARQGRGALIAGPGGVGKSTTVLACTAAGFDCLGDDRIGVERLDDGRLVGWSLYGSVQLAGGDLERHPLLSHAEERERLPTGKAVAFLGRACRERLVARATVDVVLLPRLAARDINALEPARPHDALVRMIASTLACRLHGGQAEVDRLADIAQGTPCYWLDVGAGLDDIPALVAEALGMAEGRR